MMKGLRALPAMLMVAGVWITTPACAAQTYGYGRPTYGGYGREVERQAYDTGYRDGVRAGERDGRDGRSFSYSRHDDWRDADNGYHREYGNRDFYRRTFRSGFEAGYSDSYNRYANYGRYPRGGSYPTYPSYPSYPTDRGGVAVPRGSIAMDTGYRDGFEAGRDDARDRDRFDYRRAKRYREGDHGYESRYGSRDAYKQDYRTAFQRGYEDGYRGNARR